MEMLYSRIQEFHSKLPLCLNDTTGTHCQVFATPCMTFIVKQGVVFLDFHTIKSCYRCLRASLTLTDNRIWRTYQMNLLFRKCQWGQGTGFQIAVSLFKMRVSIVYLFLGQNCTIMCIQRRIVLTTFQLTKSPVFLLRQGSNPKSLIH